MVIAPKFNAQLWFCDIVRFAILQLWNCHLIPTNLNRFFAAKKKFQYEMLQFFAEKAAQTPTL